AVDGFAVAERRNEFCAIKIGQGRFAETQIWRLLRYDLDVLQITCSINIECKFDNASQRYRSPRVGITYPRELRVLTNIRLRIDEISFLIQFRQLLIGENAQPRFAIHDREPHRAVENSEHRFMVMNRGNELRIGQTFYDFFLEQFVSLRAAILGAPV